MSAPSAPKHTQPLWRDLAVFTALLGFFLFSARQMRRAEAPASNPSFPVARAPASPPALGRAPSSATAAKSQPERNVGTAHLPCLTDGSPEPTRGGARLFRLSAPRCGLPREIFARNETTGENILIFVREQQWVSSYFPLAEGRNEVVLQWREKGRERTQRVEIFRSSES